MNVSEIGEARIRGYLFVLGRSLRSFLPADVAEDAVREVGSHIRERIEQAAPQPDERQAVERVLMELGPPLKVAQAYSQEMTLDEAVTTGRLVPTLRATWQVATTSVVGFCWGLLVFVGWTLGVSFVAVAVTKMVLPNNVGIFTRGGEFAGAGAAIVLPPGTEVAPVGYWIVPVSLLAGLAVVVGTQRASRHMLAWMRGRRQRVVRR